MVKDAEAHADEDKKRRESVEARNQAEALIHTAEKTLTDANDKIPAEDKTAVEEAVSALKDVIDSDDINAIKEKTNALQEASMKLGEHLYRAEQEAAATAGESAPSDSEAKAENAKDDDTEVVDAEFTEIDDDKKNKSAG